MTKWTSYLYISTIVYALSNMQKLYKGRSRRSRLPCDASDEKQSTLWTSVRRFYSRRLQHATGHVKRGRAHANLELPEIRNLPPPARPPATNASS